MAKKGAGIFEQVNEATHSAIRRAKMNRQNLIHLRELHASRPTKWLCSAVDENGRLQAYGFGDTEAEARINANTATKQFRDKSSSCKTRTRPR
jgi:hypothetical protein